MSRSRCAARSRRLRTGRRTSRDRGNSAAPCRWRAPARPVVRSGSSVRPRRLRPAAGSVTSSSMISPTSPSLRAVRLVRDRPRPAPERAIVAPSSRARLAMPKANESSVRTPVTRIRWSSRSAILLAYLPTSIFRGRRWRQLAFWEAPVPPVEGSRRDSPAPATTVVLGSRDADRAEGDRAGSHASRRGHGRGRHERRGRGVQPGGRGDAVGFGDRHDQRPAPTAQGQDRDLDGERALARRS